MPIDWNSYSGRITPNFTIHEALWLPSFHCHHEPSGHEKSCIERMAQAAERVRAFIGKPMVVHCWIRPERVNAPHSQYHGTNYNAFVKGAKRSGHIDGSAMDFHFLGHVTARECDRMRAMLAPALEELGIRLENHSGPWLHIDIKKPITARYFRP